MEATANIAGMLGVPLGLLDPAVEYKRCLGIVEAVKRLPRRNAVRNI
jgi:hypothetical protein